MRGSTHFEELIRYVFFEFLSGCEDAITLVAEELRVFGEKGELVCYRDTTSAAI